MAKFLKMLVTFLILGGIGYGLYKLPDLLGTEADETQGATTYTVVRRTLEDRVVERGEVESQKTVFGKCEIYDTKITFIVPEGSTVKKGDIVCEFDTENIDKAIREKEIAVNEALGKLAEAKQALEIKINENDTNIAAAKLAYEIAVIELKKFEKGDFQSEVADLRRAIKEAGAELAKVQDEKKNTELLVKKGYRTPQQLVEYQLREQNFQFQVERDEKKLEVLVTYDKEKRLIEYRGKVAETKLKYERAEKTAEAERLQAEAAIANAKSGVEIVQQQLEEDKELRRKASLIAEQDGTVAYANERWYDPEDRIRQGTEMYRGRAVYYLPDMTRMQVKANVHESVVDRIAVDQKATVRLEAFSDQRLSGTVSSVAGMAASSYSSVQNYETVVVIDELPSDLAIKPGMTAEVDILVGTYRDVIAVPVGAITEHFEQAYVYVMKGRKAERRKVETGRTTHSFVEITEGLEEGEVVALDAYQRGIEDFSEAERSSAESVVDQPPQEPSPA